MEEAEMPQTWVVHGVRLRLHPGRHHYLLIEKEAERDVMQFENARRLL
jgi:hypothetical protein